MLGARRCCQKRARRIPGVAGTDRNPAPPPVDRAFDIPSGLFLLPPGNRIAQGFPPRLPGAPPAPTTVAYPDGGSTETQLIPTILQAERVSALSQSIRCPGILSIANMIHAPRSRQPVLAANPLASDMLRFGGLPGETSCPGPAIRVKLPAHLGAAQATEKLGPCTPRPQTGKTRSRGSAAAMACAGSTCSARPPEGRISTRRPATPTSSSSSSRRSSRVSSTVSWVSGPTWPKPSGARSIWSGWERPGVPRMQGLYRPLAGDRVCRVTRCPLPMFI